MVHVRSNSPYVNSVVAFSLFCIVFSVTPKNSAYCFIDIPFLRNIIFKFTYIESPPFTPRGNLYLNIYPYSSFAKYFFTPMGNFLLLFALFHVKIQISEVCIVDFLDKLNYLMNENNLNKSTLSKACEIPYTTIDGWYKKGYEGLKLTTLRKLANYFGTSLDFWALEDIDVKESNYFSDKEKKLISDFRELNSQGQDYILQTMDLVKDKYKKCDSVSELENLG